jgi:hypothetical protein
MVAVPTSPIFCGTAQSGGGAAVTATGQQVIESKKEARPFQPPEEGVEAEGVPANSPLPCLTTTFNSTARRDHTRALALDQPQHFCRTALDVQPFQLTSHLVQAIDAGFEVCC